MAALKLNRKDIDLKRFALAILLSGFTSMISQIVLVRELLVLFYGNELSIGIILANWLWWTGAGSFLGALLSKRIKNALYTIAIVEMLIAFVTLFTILAVRAIKLLLPTAPGEIIGLVPIWLLSFALLSGLCALNGFLFVAGCSLWNNFTLKKNNPSLSINIVYILEAVGSALGGILCSLLLIRFFDSIQIAWMIAILNLACASVLLQIQLKKIPFPAVILTILFVASALLDFPSKLHSASIKWQWPNSPVTVSEDSIYGNVTVTKHDSIFNFYENGLLAFSVPDLFSAEWHVHPAMLQFDQPKKVLLISGGVNGSLNELLKYDSLRQIDYVELDPLLISLSKDILPEPYGKPLDNPKVNIHYGDGYRYLFNSKEIYDVIIINLPDPYTAQLNRFYTLEFYKETARHLSPSGVLFFGVSSAENYISPELGDFLRCIYYTLKDVFREIKVIPGESNYFICSNENDYTSIDSNVLQKRLDECNISTTFVRDYYLQDRLNTERANSLLGVLSSKTAPILNTDFHPICYYYNITIWSTYFNYLFKQLFAFMAKIKLWYFIFFVTTAVICVFAPIRIDRKYSVLIPITTSGFSEISFQVVILLAFQAIYGYVYYKLGIILTSFMIGLFLGAFTVKNIIAKTSDNYPLFVKTQAAMTIYPLILPVIFYYFAHSKNLSFFGENIVFPALPVIAGFAGGFQFPLGNKIYLSKYKELGGTAGLTYGLDLFGACIGALLISGFILPILGITQTCIITALINLSALIFMLRPEHKFLPETLRYPEDK